MQINFHGQYDRDLFFKAVRLANRPARNRNGLMYFMLVVALGALGVLAVRIVENGDVTGNIVYLAAAVILGGVAAFNLVQPYFAARKLWANPGVQRELKGQITALGITYLLPEGKNEIPWGQFNRLRQTAGLVTLVRRDGLLVIFSRYFFKSSGDWGKFKRLVEEKIVSAEGVPRRRR
jgi:hypothetical protein